MKIRQAAALAAHVASRSSAIQILQHVRIDGRHITACDISQQIEIPIDAIEGLNGAVFCVHAARLTRILKALPEEAELKLRVKDARVFLSAGATRYELNAMAPEDFPRLDMPEAGADGVTVPTKPLVDALRFCTPAMATADIRYYLNGMHLGIFPGRMEITATDGHRLHRARVPLDGGGRQCAAILPWSSVARIIEISGEHKDIELSLTDTLALIDTGRETLSAKLIDGKFPEAERVIPAGRPASGTVPRLAFVDAARRVAQIFDGEKFQGIQVDFTPGAIELSAKNAGQETAAERFEWSAVDTRLKPLSIGFQWQFLAEAIEAFPGERVNLHLPDNDQGSLYVTDTDDGKYQVVLMPARI